MESFGTAALGVALFPDAGEFSCHFLRSEFRIGNIPNSFDRSIPRLFAGNTFRLRGGGPSNSHMGRVDELTNRDFVFTLENEIEIVVVAPDSRFFLIRFEQVVHFFEQVG